VFALSNSFKLFVAFFNECTRGRLTSLTPPLFIEVPVPRQETEWSCICVSDIDFSSFYDFDILFWNCFDIVFSFSFYIYVFCFYS